MPSVGGGFGRPRSFARRAAWPGESLHTLGARWRRWARWPPFWLTGRPAAAPGHGGTCPRALPERPRFITGRRRPRFAKKRPALHGERKHPFSPQRIAARKRGGPPARGGCRLALHTGSRLRTPWDQLSNKLLIHKEFLVVAQHVLLLPQQTTPGVGVVVVMGSNS